MTRQTVRLICLIISLALCALALAWDPEPASPTPQPTVVAPRAIGVSRGGRPVELVAPVMARAMTTAVPAATPTIKSSEAVNLGLFKVTAYSDSPLNGTDGRGITRSGEPTRWGVVAVDQSIIPLRSRLAIEGWEGMTFMALDTGGGVIGRHVDLWLPNDAMALGWGARMVRVWRLE